MSGASAGPRRTLLVATAVALLSSQAEGVSLSHSHAHAHPKKHAAKAPPPPPAAPKPDDHTASVLDDGLNSAVSMEADVALTAEAEGLLESRGKQQHHGRRGKHVQGKSWMPFDDWVLALNDLVPKADPNPITPDAKTDPAPVSLMALSSLDLSLTEDQKLSMRKDPSKKIEREFVYPRLDFLSTAFSGDSNSNTDPVFLYLKNGGFRYTVDGTDLVANRALLPINPNDCFPREMKYSSRYCPSVKFPAAISFDAWRPFTMLANNEKEMKQSKISFQWVSAAMKDQVFDIDNFANDKKVKNFAGAFVFKRDGTDEIEWRCQNNGYGFLGVKDFAINLHAVNKHHNKQVGKGQKKTDAEKIARPLMLHMKSSVEASPSHSTDALVLIDAARKVSFVYPNKDSDKTCQSVKSTPKDCFEVHGGFELEAAGGEVLKVGMQPVPEGDTTAFAQTHLRFNEHSCPGHLDSASLDGVIAEDAWQTAPYSFAGKNMQMAWIHPEVANKHHLFGKCKDPNHKHFGGAFVFRDSRPGKKDAHAWRCLDRTAKGGAATSASLIDAGSSRREFPGAQTEDQSMVNEMVDDLSQVDVSVDNSAGMVAQNVDSVPGDDSALSIPAKTNDAWF